MPSKIILTIALKPLDYECNILPLNQKLIFNLYEVAHHLNAYRKYATM